MTENIEFKKRRDFGQVINDTFTFMRQNFKPLIKTYFIFCGLFVLASLLCALAWNIQSMIAFRALQGFLGGSMIPLVFTTANTPRAMVDVT